MTKNLKLSEVTEIVTDTLSGQLGLDKEKINFEETLLELGFDSLDSVEIPMEIAMRINDAAGKTVLDLDNDEVFYKVFDNEKTVSNVIKEICISLAAENLLDAKAGKARE